MEAFSVLLAIFHEIHMPAIDSSRKWPVMRIFDIFFVVRLSNLLRNTQVVLDFRRHDSHVMSLRGS